MNVTNRDYPFITNSDIVEWDIRSANVSLMQYYHLADQELIDKLSRLPKQKREEAVGKYHLKQKGFGTALEHAFNSIIEEFMSSNSLTMDDVVAIKKDAVFVKNRKIIQPVFGDCVEFREKGHYRHALLLPRYEFYLSDSEVDVKGISDVSLGLHMSGMLQFVRNVMNSAHDWNRMNQYLKEFVDAYKKKELEFSMYREFTSDSIFRIHQGGQEILLDEIDEDDVPYLDTGFNYINIVIPTIQATF